jgi:hypothetical protein
MLSMAYINPHWKYGIIYDGCCIIMMHIFKAEPLNVIEKYGTESIACCCGSNYNHNITITLQIGRDNTMEVSYGYIIVTTPM